MAGLPRLNVQRSWEAGLGMGLGALAGLAPWLAGEMDSAPATWNAMVVGTLIFALAELELVDSQRWARGGQIACGLWLIASPYAFGYLGSGALAYWHTALGAAVVLLAAVELWQDRTLGGNQLARHGR